MARQFNQVYTVGFITVISTICALALSLAATGLHDRQERNVSFYVRQNILKALQAPGITPTSSPADVDKFFTQRIKAIAVDFNGKVKEGVDGSKVRIEDEEHKGIEDRLYPLYIMDDGAPAPQPLAYAFPIYGKGLWSTVYGYLALQKDYNEVRGVTFYKHGETPGLGGDVEKDMFQLQWRGKKILDAKGALVSIIVAKGKVEPTDAQRDHKVDGISGATMTGNGVNRFLKVQLEVYEKYFHSLEPVLKEVK